MAKKSYNNPYIFIDDEEYIELEKNEYIPKNTKWLIKKSEVNSTQVGNPGKLPDSEDEFWQQINTDPSDNTDKEPRYTAPEPPPCGFVPQRHTWVSSGFPGGNAWCKYCNVDYSADLLGKFED